jgi:hypothetical protein
MSDTVSSTSSSIAVVEFSKQPENDASLSYLGDPTKHYRYSTLKSGSFSDFRPVLNEKSFPVHNTTVLQQYLFELYDYPTISKSKS